MRKCLISRVSMEISLDVANEYMKVHYVLIKRGWHENKKKGVLLNYIMPTRHLTVGAFEYYGGGLTNVRTFLRMLIIFV